MYIDPQPILSCIRRYRGQLHTVTIEAPSWPELRRFLDDHDADYVAVHYVAHRVRHVIVIGGTDIGEWHEAQAVVKDEALRLARLWLNLRRPDEVTTSPSWSARTPREGCTR
jgi:hypothetical protein